MAVKIPDSNPRSTAHSKFMQAVRRLQKEKFAVRGLALQILEQFRHRGKVGL